MYHVDFNDVGRRADGNKGCLPRPCAVGVNPRFKVWGTVDDCPTIPRDQWETCSLRSKIREVVNQSSYNTCSCASTRGAIQIVREMWGLRFVSLSQSSTYSQVCGGRDQGANIMDVLESMMDIGMAPISVVPEYDWRERNYPSRWKDHASKYRILEAWDCPTFGEMISAVQKSVPVVFGVNWDGGGHAICCIGYDKETKKAEILNSWGEEWGDHGIGYLSESQCKAISMYGAFAIRSIVVPSDEELPPAPKV